MFGIAADAISLAGSYVMLSLGWVVIFRATNVLNFATGEFMALGAYVFYALLVQAGLDFPISMVLGLLACAAFGGLCYLLVIRRLVSQPPYIAVITTFGISIVLAAVIDVWQGANLKNLPDPYATSTINLPDGARLSVVGLITAIGAVVVVVLLVLFMRKTSFGIQMRAAAEDPGLSARSGIRVSRIMLLSWALAGIVTALGGISYGYTNVISPQASELGILGLAPALVGGFESVGGTLAGSLIVAVAEVTAVKYLGGAADEAAVFAVLLLFLLLRPHGLFGTSSSRRV
jgi:branched-chain amino acid transport system permease protein